MSNWIVWEGGPCPLPNNTCVRVKLRNGSIKNEPNAYCLGWHHFGGEADILKYMVIDLETNNNADALLILEKAADDLFLAETKLEKVNAYGTILEAILQMRENTSS